MKKRLLIIDTYPTVTNLLRINNHLTDLDLEDNVETSIFLIDYGVFYLIDEFWEQLHKLNNLFYAHAHDADKYSIPFKEDVVFSGMPALQQLMDTTEKVYRFNEDIIFPEPLLTERR